MTTTRCTRCKSSNVRQQWSTLLDPNDPDCIKNFDPTTLDFDGFEYCVDCEDETKTFEDNA